MAFGLAQNGSLWTITSDGVEEHFEMPIYREIAFVDMSGREQIKVSNECTEYPFVCGMKASNDLKDVSKPANTLYKSETYFSESAKLKAGEAYIGSPIGFHLPPEVAYASAQYRPGERYRGVLRMTAPGLRQRQTYRHPRHGNRNVASDGIHRPCCAVQFGAAG